MCIDVGGATSGAAERLQAEKAFGISGRLQTRFRIHSIDDEQPGLWESAACDVRPLETRRPTGVAAPLACMSFALPLCAQQEEQRRARDVSAGELPCAIKGNPGDRRQLSLSAPHRLWGLLLTLYSAHRGTTSGHLPARKTRVRAEFC